MKKNNEKKINRSIKLLKCNINISPFSLKKIGVSKTVILSKIKKIGGELNLINCEFNLIVCNDPAIKKLNKKYRNIDMPTDVLSFEMNEFCEETECKILGDIFISIDTVKRQAAEYGISTTEEFFRMLIHGLLHLTGMTHKTDSDYKKMMKLNENILTGIL